MSTRLRISHILGCLQILCTSLTPPCTCQSLCHSEFDVLQEVNHVRQLLYDFPWSHIGKLAFLVSMTERRPSGNRLSTWDLAKPALPCQVLLLIHTRLQLSLMALWLEACSFHWHFSSLCRVKNLRSSQMVCPLHGNWFTTRVAPSGHGTCCSSSATATGSFSISNQC